MGTRSGFEDAYLAAVLARGLPMPLANVRLAVGTELVEVDFRWPAWRLCVEVDGPAHGRLTTQMQDADRDAMLAGAGYTVLRCKAGGIGRCVEQVARIAAAR